jgi:hypothetical protein
MNNLKFLAKKIESKFGNDREQKVDAILFDHEKDAKVEELNSISSFTYNDGECEMVMKKVWVQLNISTNSWKAIRKVRAAVTLLPMHSILFAPL